MKILITGANGFIGRNLIATLNHMLDMEVSPYDVDTDPALLDLYCAQADFVVHLAGINRPIDNAEFMAGNFGFTTELLNALKAHDNHAPILVTSSIQATLDNPYGLSKKAGEDAIFAYGKENGVQVFVYRLPNVFGKWCRPNYNSAVATFCHNIAHELPITVNDPGVMMALVFIDDVVNEIVRCIEGSANRTGQFFAVPIVHLITLGEIVELLGGFHDSRKTLAVPNVGNDFERKLYATYLSYLPPDQFSHPLKMNFDLRGSFTEFIRTPDRGQFSVNISKPGITKGNHWHHTKNEKFLVVSGRGVIRFRKIDNTDVLEYFVSGDILTVVDIPTGYTHNIENLSETQDMVTLMWASEAFDPAKLDTFFEEV